jgi:hypothetical protein
MEGFGEGGVELTAAAAAAASARGESDQAAVHDRYLAGGRRALNINDI